MNRVEHLITILDEECGEVSKECHKAKRFGLSDRVTKNPNGPRGRKGPTNRQKIVAEMIDLLGAYQKCVEEGILPNLGFDTLSPTIQRKMRRKGKKIEGFLGYSHRVGTLTEKTPSKKRSGISSKNPSNPKR